MLSRFVSFTLIAGVLAWGIFFIVGKVVYAQAAGENDAVPIRDVLGYGSHHFAGIIDVPQTCDQLQEHIEEISPNVYRIDFQTWQDPSLTCNDDGTPRTFSDALFAPATGVDFTATMNDQPFSIEVIPTVQPTQ